MSVDLVPADRASVEALDPAARELAVSRYLTDARDRLACGRYNGELNDEVTITKLANMRGGIGGLMGRAFTNKERLKQPLNQCVAATVVEVLNAGKGGAKLPSWWREDAA